MGPMIYGLVIYSSDDTITCKNAGHADSKTLTDASRDALAPRLFDAAEGLEPPVVPSGRAAKRPTVGWCTMVTNASQIDHLLLQHPKYTLIRFAEESTALLLAMATRHHDITTAYIDTVGPKLTYQRLLTALFPDVMEITVEEEAEDKFVGAAAVSVITKHFRDRPHSAITMAKRHKR